jgi:hypothetical protein
MACGLAYDTLVYNFEIIGSNLFAGTDLGIWHRPLSQLIDNSAGVSAAGKEQIITAYPNPFSQSSTITFSCAESGVAVVTIVNLLGAEVARLFSGELGAGEHSFEWDANGVAAGIYECIVRVNGTVQRIVLVCGPK